MAKKSFSEEQWGIFTDELKNILNYIKNVITNEHPVLTINENYFLLAIFEYKDCFAYRIIDALLSSTTSNLIRDAYFRIVTKGQLMAIKPNREIHFDSKFMDLINESMDEMKKLNDEKLSSIHVILALINPDREHQNTQKIMKGAGLNYQLLTNKLSSLKGETTVEEEKEEQPIKNEKNKNIKTNILPGFELAFQGMGQKSVNGQFLTNYCINLNKKAKEGKVDPVIGRDKEIERITKIFNRRKKNNVVIVGDKGSGKTAICESLAWLITNNQAPYSLKDKTILKLDIPSMIAGTTYRGMFEERAKGVFTELQKNPKCILFIDDFHTHTTKKDTESSTDITPYLKEVIGDGSVKVIVTSTPQGYHKKFDSDQSLANKFQRIDLIQLKDDEIKNILMNVKSIYEKHHSIKINEDIIELCISLCKKYVTDREMPDSVIDLIDEVGACVSKKYEESFDIKELKDELKALNKSKSDAIKKQKFDELDSIIEKETKKAMQIKEKENNPNCDIVEITDKMIFETISEKTGIPIQNLSDENKKDLSNINSRLKESIIGQDEAIDKVCKTIKRKRLGLHNGRSSAMFFQGKTGCGKCVTGNTIIKVRNKNTNEIMNISMNDFFNLIKTKNNCNQL